MKVPTIVQCSPIQLDVDAIQWHNFQRCSMLAKLRNNARELRYVSAGSGYDKNVDISMYIYLYILSDCERELNAIDIF